MVLDVTIELAFFVISLAFEFAEYLLVGLAENVSQGRQTAAMGHADEYFFHPVLGAFFHYGVQRRNQGLTALEGKALLADKLFLKKLFKQRCLCEFFQNLNPVFHADARAVGELDVLAHPGLALHVLNGHVLDTDGMAVREFQMVDDFLQCRRPDAHFRSCLKDRVQICRRQAEILQTQIRTVHATGSYRIGLREEVAPDAVRVNQVDDLKFLEGLRGRCILAI